MIDTSAWCKIKAIPNGGFAANMSVAVHWLGLTLPCAPKILTCEGNQFFGVPQKEALGILKEKVASGPDIVLWYESCGFPQRDVPYFYVPADCAEFVPAPA